MNPPKIMLFSLFDRDLYAEGLTNHFVVAVVFVNISLTLDYQARGQFQD